MAGEAQGDIRCLTVSCDYLWQAHASCIPSAGSGQALARGFRRARTLVLPRESQARRASRCIIPPFCHSSHRPRMGGSQGPNYAKKNPICCGGRKAGMAWPAKRPGDFCAKQTQFVGTCESGKCWTKSELRAKCGVCLGEKTKPIRPRREDRCGRPCESDGWRQCAKQTQCAPADGRYVWSSLWSSRCRFVSAKPNLPWLRMIVWLGLGGSRGLSCGTNPIHGDVRKS